MIIFFCLFSWYLHWQLNSMKEEAMVLVEVKLKKSNNLIIKAHARHIKFFAFCNFVGIESAECLKLEFGPCVGA